MDVTDLSQLSSAVEYLMRQDSFSETLTRLREELARTTETFVWETVDLASIPVDLPAKIRSGWAFHLRRDVPSGAHSHPNSVQHMALVSGRGISDVGGVRRAMVPFATPAATPAGVWLVIGEGVTHEFLPEGEDMTVVSFHTCAADALEEVGRGTGNVRRSERPPQAPPRDGERLQRLYLAPGFQLLTRGPRP